jgi:flagella basal body P-ring formation protein FlgA
MAAIGELEGINSGEVTKLCKIDIRTVQDLLDQLEPDFFYGLTYVSVQTGIKHSRLAEVLPPEVIALEDAPDFLVEELAERVLRDAAPDDNWIKRCGYGLGNRFERLKGNWGGWKDNVPLIFLSGVIFIVIMLAVRAAGGFQWIPDPFPLRDRALVAVDTLESGKVLVTKDMHSALLPFESDYFRADRDVEGLVLARRVSGQMPLRFRDVVRQQLIATKDIAADATIQKEDVTLAWARYQPGAVLTYEEVVGRKAKFAIRKDLTMRQEYLAEKE